jgi:hypothetical protein
MREFGSRASATDACGARFDAELGPIGTAGRTRLEASRRIGCGAGQNLGFSNNRETGLGANERTLVNYDKAGIVDFYR